MQISLHRRNKIVLKNFRNIPSQASTYLLVWHLIPTPLPPPLQHILNDQEVSINELFRQVMVKMTTVRL